MPPAHFAITEVLIVFTSIYSVYLLKNRRDFFALIGIILIGLAATLGAIRFGLSSGETIIKLNTILGIYSGLTCIGLISVQMAYNLQWKHIYKLLLAILIISLIVSILWPKQFLSSVFAPADIALRRVGGGKTYHAATQQRAYEITTFTHRCASCGAT